MAEFMVAPWQLRGENGEKQEESRTGYSVSQPRSELGSSVVQTRSLTVPATVFVFFTSSLYVGYTKSSSVSEMAKLRETSVPLPGNGLVPLTYKIWLQGILYC
jgi:hypothetical protein